jgi:hypothetical protein
MRFILIVALLAIAGNSSAQELNGRFSVNASRVSSQVDKKIFNTLQSALNNFINNRKWTPDNFQPQEKIKCNFLLTIDEDLGGNVFKGTLMIQAARPVFNSTYETPLINFQDQDIVFKYIEFQPIEFNENRVQGNDALAANLPALLAYYINIIIGIDYDSFSPRGGDAYFQKAQYIVNNAPESGQITGWKAFDGIRNRFRLVEGLVDSRFNLIHDAVYFYYRIGLDQFYEKEKEARSGILNALNFLNTINVENPNSMIIQFFFQGKSTELVKIFSKAEPSVKVQARELLSRLDITNANAYKELR